MANVTFDSEADLPQTGPSQKSSGGITAWLIANKIAKDAVQANYILLGILALCVLGAGLALMNLSSTGSSIDAEERMRLEQSTRPLP
jgi:hypothetical protein